jgi:hypothetical protein
MSENVQTFSGKVNVADNLLVGTSHFFVDRQNNRVGIGTSTPDASSMLDVTGNIKSGGTITATGGFSGDGSGLSGVNSDSGSWVNGSSSNIHLAVSTDKVGIGTATPMTKLDIECNAAQPSIVFSDTSNSRYQTGIGSIHVSGQGQRLDFYTGDSGANGTLLTNSPRMSITGTGNVGIGTDEPETLFQIGSKAQTTGVNYLKIRGNNTSTFSDICGIIFNNSSNASLDGLRGESKIINERAGNNYGSTLAFYTNPTDVGTGGTGVDSVKRMVIDENGDLSVVGGIYDTKFKLKKGGTICREYTTGAGDLGAGLHFTEDGFYPTDKDGNLSNGVVNFGGESNRFNSLYAKDSVYVSDYFEHGGSNFFGKRHPAINGILAGMEIENTTLGGNYSQKVHLRSHYYGVSHGRRLTVNESGFVGIGTESPSYKLHVSAGDNSITFYGPNTSWNSTLAVGAASDKTSSGNTGLAQCISTNGNLHLDAGHTRDIYMNYYRGSYIRHNGSGLYSDDRLKSEEELITNATDTLLKLSPQKYLKRRTLREDEDRDPIIETGLIAQDIWYDAPELRHLVHLGADATPVDTKPVAPVDGDIQQDPDYSSWGPNEASVNYDGLIAYLIKSNQEIYEELQTTKSVLEADLQTTKEDLQTTKEDLQSKATLEDLQTVKTQLQTTNEQNQKLEARIAFLETALISR